MIEVSNVTKRYGSTVAVDRLTFEVRAGEVTGFLGPNGAGKSTTMRMMVGLDSPTSGTVTIDGKRYADMRFPLHHVGALLEARAIHPSRSARNHLLALAQSNGIGRRRVDEVLDLVGLADVGDRRAGGFSLGMGQRLGIAAALLGDPSTLILDEPVNGLDPEGIQWIRQLLRSFATEGRAVLVSSHLMSEMALTADRLIVIGRGRLITEGTVDEVVRSSTDSHVHVATAEPDTLHALLARAGATVDVGADGSFLVSGIDAPSIGAIAAAASIPLHALTTRTASLEDAYMELTRESAEYRTHPQLATAGQGAPT
jgi:ABC-2 type transport system ATP-binding protein